ncbi:hypothetical protein CALVIDRAFT_87397 [Calocera viscosa TUFC12733]|uniref:Uncharacterized protein n=1 Tax=Calocera viscosa (strain TUFC12733) TaxID=1330018 RepID=A0A167N6K6_CALVF|nr:hypothetical protein CALVIDRAFT_87397 [Calocera viscosa TUFC12733]
MRGREQREPPLASFRWTAKQGQTVRAIDVEIQSPHPSVRTSLRWGYPGHGSGLCVGRIWVPDNDFLLLSSSVCAKRSLGRFYRTRTPLEMNPWPGIGGPGAGTTSSVHNPAAGWAPSARMGELPTRLDPFPHSGTAPPSSMSQSTGPVSAAHPFAQSVSCPVRAPARNQSINPVRCDMSLPPRSRPRSPASLTVAHLRCFRAKGKAAAYNRIEVCDRAAIGTIATQSTIAKRIPSRKPKPRIAAAHTREAGCET